MADIRSTGMLDDFEGPAENPLSRNGRWATVSRTLGNLKVGGGAVDLAVTPNSTAYFHWTLNPGIQGDGEVWAIWGGVMDDGGSSQLGLVTDIGIGNGTYDGYFMRGVNTFGGSGWEMRKYTNGGSSVIGAAGGWGPLGPLVPDDLVLVRRDGDQIQGWHSRDTVTWHKVIDVTDTTYVNNMRIALGHSVAIASSPLWKAVGGGQKNHQQIFRWVSN